MNYSYHLALLCVLLTFCQNSYSQLYEINIENTFEFGSPHSVDHFAIAIDPNSGHQAHLGSTKSNGDFDLLLTLFDDVGDTLWQTSIDHNGQEDYGISVCFDPNGDLFVTGASESSGSTEVLLAHYEANGTQSWKTSWTAAGALAAYPVEILCESVDEFYLTGTVSNTTSLHDVFLAEFDNQGNENWSVQYDYQNEEDAPIDVRIDGNGDLNVAGYSSDSLQDWGMLVLIYDNTGQSIGNNRVSLNTGMDQPTAWAIDNQNNKYIAGFTTTATDGEDLVLVKVNAQNSVDWSRSFDYSGGNDRAFDLTWDNANNLYVCGNGENDAGNTDQLLLKYDLNGNLIWQKEYALQTGRTTEAHQMVIKSGEIYVAGITRAGSTADFLLTAWDNSGAVNWSKSWSNGNEAKGVAHIEPTTNNGISVNGYTSGLASGSYVRFEIDAAYRDLTTETTTGSLSLDYVKNEILLEVNPDLVKRDFADDTDLKQNELYQALDSVLADSIAVRLSEIVDINQLWVSKVNPAFTTSDTLSLARTGQWIELPPLWNQLVLHLNGDINEEQVANLLNETGGIYYAQLNVIPQPLDIPNDPDLQNDDQGALIPTNSFPNSHIFADKAWDVQKGNKRIVTGVFDSGVEWKHHDFTPGDKENPDSSKVSGHDFENDRSFLFLSSKTLPDPGQHGTSCASIIGSTRNDNFGVAGIAGGDWDNNRDYGCLIMAARIGRTTTQPGAWTYLPTSKIVQSFNMMGVKSNTGTGFGIDIANLSIDLGGSLTWPFQYNNNSNNLISIAKAVQNMSRNGVVTVAARGNSGSTAMSFPAVFDDSWTISVGAFDPTRSRRAVSSYDKNMDLLAPGHPSLIQTDNSFQLAATRDFKNTSAAAPHVAGVAALVLSEFNGQSPLYEDLSVEDVEYLVQKYTSTSPTCSSYPSPECGWGALNAQEVMEHMDYPKYRIDHFTHTNFGPGSSVNLGSKTITVTEDVGVIKKGTYTGELIKISKTVSHSIRTQDQVLGHWVRENFSTGLQNPSTGVHVIPGIPGGSITAFSQSSATLETYQYRIKINGSWVYYPGNITMSYGAHLYDANATEADFFTGQEEGIEKQKSSLSVYPNPAGDQVSVRWITSKSEKGTLRVCDLNGSSVYIESKTIVEGQNEWSLSLEGLSSGMYIIELKTAEKFETKRLVIQ
ncbi:S8 family serine peptidase [bacterium SCSIO 12741]|nr:S8 family serine peptidase [bacterium SCSIO 12741]